MSTTPEPPPALPPQERNGCLTAIMVAIGVILLLPGACSLFFIFAGLVKTASDVQFVVALLMAGGFGVVLLWWAFRRRVR
jgi:hypothetical protein